MRNAHVRVPVALAIAVSCCSLLAACGKKDHAKPGDAGGISAKTDEDSLKYLMYRIMQATFVDGGRDKSTSLPTYYWYDQVPQIEPFSTTYKTADDLLSYMIGFPVNPTTGGAIDRYSFLDRTGQVSDEIQNGVVDGVFDGIDNTGALGMEASYVADDAGKSHLVILYADKNSPAGKLGINRGWEVTAINGDTSVSYDGPDGKNTTRASNAIYGSTAVTFRFINTDKQTVNYTVSPAQYNVNPILFDTVYNWNAHKVGYFVFYTFSSTYNNQGRATNTKTVLDQEFQKLSGEGISDLIVDLRYNGGGSVLTAEYLDSAIAPASTQGQLMYQYYYNDKLTKQAGLLGLDSKVNFPGGGSLHLDHVFFIVSRSTASASELTINNLKPYMDVKLVGDTTYGKPVGFIDFTISDYDSTGASHHLADLYAIDFETKNSQGQGGYFEGIPPDAEATDYVGYSWGDLGDENLSMIQHYLSNGNFARSIPAARRSGSVQSSGVLLHTLSPARFNGMVDYRLSKKIKASIR